MTNELPRNLPFVLRKIEPNSWAVRWRRRQQRLHGRKCERRRRRSGHVTRVVSGHDSPRPVTLNTNSGTRLRESSPQPPLGISRRSDISMRGLGRFCGFRERLHRHGDEHSSGIGRWLDGNDGKPLQQLVAAFPRHDGVQRARNLAAKLEGFAVVPPAGRFAIVCPRVAAVVGADLAAS